MDPLAPTSAEELLHILLGADASLTGLKRVLIDRTEGNPFFLEESVRTLVETKALAGAPGAYRLAEPIQATGVPASVHAVLAARIDRLPVEEKRLLQAAAVIGHDVPFALLQVVGEENESDLRRGLALLQAAEFLYQTSLFPDLEFSFKHALTHEVTYGTLLQQRRRELHARIVEVIERLYADRLSQHVERLAYHALKGEVWDRAVPYLPGVCMRADRRSTSPARSAIWVSRSKRNTGWLKHTLLVATSSRPRRSSSKPSKLSRTSAQRSSSSGEIRLLTQARCPASSRLGRTRGLGSCSPIWGGSATRSGMQSKRCRSPRGRTIRTP